MPVEEKDNQDNNVDTSVEETTTSNDTSNNSDTTTSGEEYSETDIKKETEGMDAEEAARVRRVLKERNEEAKKHRLRAKELEDKVNQFEDLGVDPDTVKQWKEERDAAEMKRLEDERNWEEIKTKLKEDKDQSVKKERERAEQLEEQINALKKERENDLVEKEAMRVLNDLEGEPTFIMPYLSKEVTVIDDNGKSRAVVKDEITGDPRTKEDGSYFTIEDRLKEMREDKVFGKAFAAPKVSGSGSNPSTANPDGNNKGRPPKTTKAELRKNPSKLENFVKTYGMDAYNKLKAS